MKLFWPAKTFVSVKRRGKGRKGKEGGRGEGGGGRRRKRRRQEEAGGGGGGGGGSIEKTTNMIGGSLHRVKS